MKPQILRRALAGGLIAFALIAATSASSALAEAQYILDPQLSLTGSCTTDEIDPVADPSCPYEAFPAGPSEPFDHPRGMALDTYGDLYVAVGGPSELGEETHGHVDVFDAEGHFLTEISTPGQLQTVAVDSKGYLYVYANTDDEHLLRYAPTPSYDPAAGKIAYQPTPAVIDPPGWDGTGGGFYSAWAGTASLAVNPENDHLFINFGNSASGAEAKLRGSMVEFGSGAEGSPLLDDEVAEVKGNSSGRGLAIDQSRGRLYVTDKGPDLPGGAPDEGLRLIRVFELAAPHHLIETLDGSSLPEGTFVKCGYEPENCVRAISLAVDEGTGNLFAYDYERRNLIYEMTAEGQYLASIQGNLGGFTAPQVVVDNGKESPNGAQRPEGRYLWADAAPRGTGHAFAFAPLAQCPPVVESTSVAHVGEGEALLRADIEPCQLGTSYRLEYVSAEQFAESGFDAAKVAGEGTIASGGNPVEVSAGARGLAAGTEYVFRAAAENALGKDEGQGSFKTYPAAGVSTACPNQSLRTGPSALLPDCRAYELVTPPNTNGLIPMGSGFAGALFLSRTVSLAGGDVFFRIEGGALLGSEGTGTTFGYPYLATRGAQGWSTADGGGRSSEFRDVEIGGRSPDLGYSAWRGIVNNVGTNYLRFPDGHSEPLGQGSLGTDREALPLLISQDGGHVVFSSVVALEPGANAGGAIYDRTADGVTHVASLLPGNVTPSGQAGSVKWRGASPDGRGIAFSVDSKLYLRYNDQETYEVGEDVTYEGVAEGGKRVFYLQGGKLYAFDVEAGKIPFATSTDTTVVNVARDGSAAYFVSASKLTSAANPRGEKAKIGQQNLYLSREGQISFVAAVTERDVVGDESPGAYTVDGLGLWPESVETMGALPQDPSRSTADGRVLVFSSRAELTGYDSVGHAELYRYDSGAGTLDCLSCNPTETAAVADASLQPIPAGDTTKGRLAGFPTFKYDQIENLTPDGRRAFFETDEALVAPDVDGLRDVYEWEAQGKGTCAEAAGCLYLISSGRSAHDNFLFGVSESGEDVFILSNDLLDPGRDPDETASIYDARVNGGFPLGSAPAECLGETCQPVAKPPERPAQLLQGAGNVSKEPKHCPKGKRAVHARGKSKTRCVQRPKRHHERTNHERANAKRGSHR
jgi:hypothetical protein